MTPREPFPCSSNINDYAEMVPLFTGPYWYGVTACANCEAPFSGFSWEVNDGFDGLGPFCSKGCAEKAIENVNEEAYVSEMTNRAGRD